MKLIDHGVFTEPENLGAVASEEAPPSNRVEELRTRQSELTAQIDECAANAKHGNLAGVANMAALAEAKSLVDRELAIAEAELRQEESHRQQEEATARRARFEQLVTEARTQRTDFERLFRATCLALGTYCASVDEATALANRLVTIAGRLPLDAKAIRELTAPPNPLPGLLDSGLRPTTAFGWDFKIVVPPLKGL